MARAPSQVSRGAEPGATSCNASSKRAGSIQGKRAGTPFS